MNNVTLRGMSLDSRKVVPGDVFIAMRGTSLDGRQYIANAIANGAVAVITEPWAEERGGEVLSFSVPIIPFSNLKNSIGIMASRFYGDPSHEMPVIGVTGTNGKTSCSHFIAQLSAFLGESCGIIGTLGAGFLPALTSFNLTTPDAISVQAFLATLKETKADRIAMEVTSHALSQARVSGIQFHTAIFTNLTRDHLDYHDNFENYFQAKQKLFTEYHPKYAVLNLEDPYSVVLAKNIAAKKSHCDPDPAMLRSITPTQIIGFTTEAKIPNNIPEKTLEGSITTQNLKIGSTGIVADIQSPWGSGQLRCPLLGRFNLSNVLAAVAAMCLQGLPFNQVLAAVSALKPVKGRMHQLGGGVNEPHVVIDYAHTPDALAQVLSALRPYCTGKLWCIFGCGGDRDPGKRPLMASIVERGSDQVILTHDNPRTESKAKIIADVMQGFSAACENLLVEEDRARAIQLAIEQATPADWIVIAGKGHEAFQTVQTENIPFLDEEYARLALLRRRQ